MIRTSLFGTLYVRELGDSQFCLELRVIGDRLHVSTSTVPEVNHC